MTIAMTPRGSTFMPCLRYRDPHVAIDWLRNGPDIERHAWAFASDDPWAA